MSKILDRTRSFGEVCGLPGAVFSQDGIFFGHDGMEVRDAQHYVEEKQVDAPFNPEIPPFFVAEEAPPEPPKTAVDMSWRELKALVESYGGEYTNKQQALAFLQGNGA